MICFDNYSFIPQMKRKYSIPLVKKVRELRLENDLLAASVVTKETTIETAGHKVEEKIFSETGFNHTWE
jgi:hypothetical protein